MRLNGTGYMDDDGSSFEFFDDGSGIVTDTEGTITAIPSGPSSAPVKIVDQSGSAPRVLASDPGSLVRVAGQIYQYARGINNQGQTVYVPRRYTQSAQSAQSSSMLIWAGIGIAALLLLKK